MNEDEKRQSQLPSIEKFMVQRFSTLSLKAYKSNCEIGTKFKAPSFASPSANSTQSPEVFASNVVFTFDGFHNSPHGDHDATRYAFGLFGTFNRDSGLLSSSSASQMSGRISGGKFCLDTYNVFINYDLCDGVVEQVWNAQTRHHTPPPTFFDFHENPIHPSKAFIKRFGCSAQISQWLVNRLVAMTGMRGEMSDDDWKESQKTLVTSYYDDFDPKMKKLVKH